MTDQQNVVLLTVDSWRADHCGFMGYDADVTPTLDELAEQSLVFENAIAPAPATNTSVSALMTGQYVNPNLESDPDGYIDRMREHMRTRRTLPQTFREMGYETAGFTANPWTSRFFAYDQDFDHFEDFMDDNLSSGFVKEGGYRNVVTDAFVQALNWWQGQDMFMSWDSLAEEIDTWLADAASPYFLWIFLVDPHMPYLPPAAYRSRSRLLSYPANLSLFAGQWDLPFESLFQDVLLDSYDDSIRYTDSFVDRLLSDVGEETLVAITGDHGECFGENGTYGHGQELSEAGVHVPFLIANGPAGRVQTPFSLRRLPDLLPSMATGDGYESALEEIVWARNYDPAVLVRGKEWRYEWRPEATELAIKTDGEWTQQSNPELEAIGQQLVERFIESERERGRVLEAAADVTTTAAL